MKNKGKGNTKNMIAKVDRNLKLVAERLQKEIEDGVIKLSLYINGKEVSIMEEISASIFLMDDTQQALTLKHFLKHVDLDTIDVLASNKACINGYNSVILNSVACGDKVHIRYLTLQALKTKNKSSGEAITTIIFKALEALNGKTKVEIGYGTDTCLIATVLYWASQNGILESVYKCIPQGYVDKISVDIDAEYKETLIRYNNTFGEVYYKLKVGEITEDEYREALVSENGKMPVPRFTRLVTSPEFSWRVVDDIVGEKKLQDMEYSDEVKEIISHIFQCYYSCMYQFASELYEYSILGFYTKINNKKIKDTFKQLEFYREKMEKCEEKLKEAKISIKALRKEVEEVRKENQRLERINEKNSIRIEKLKNEGLKDVEPYKVEIEKQKVEIKRLNEKLTDCQRGSNKKNIQIKSLNTSLDSLKEQLESSEATRLEMKNKMEDTIINSSENNIPIECIVNAIKDRKIVVFGGDIFHTNLKNLGLDNIRFVSANDNSPAVSAIKNADVLVVVTKLVSHSSSSVPEITADKCGTPILYFNNKSATMLCRELFTFIYSNKYKK